MLLLGRLLLLESRANLRVTTCGLHSTSAQFLVLLNLLQALLLMSLPVSRLQARDLRRVSWAV